MLEAGHEIELAIEKPAAGGRMLARHEGRVIFVYGAIPGERVRARIEKVERQLAFASTTDVLLASPHRRETASDLWCGGCSYAHVDYAHQLSLKAELIHEAFARLGRLPLKDAVTVLPSTERGYRMRARFHVGAGQGASPVSVGFYREGTHEVCDAARTGQLLDDSVAAATAALKAAHALAQVTSAVLSENMAANQRVLHLERNGESAPLRRVLDAALTAGQLTGCSVSVEGRMIAAGIPVVEDPLPALTGGRAGSGVLRRHAEAFFQANRYLLPQLVGEVLDGVLPSGDIADLYAGVGLFSVSLAQSGRERITAVEGDRTSARDLADNASACGASIRVINSSVEQYLAAPGRRADTVIVDPPRTGISRAAMETVVRSGPTRVVYVSCDPPTMARDAKRLVDGGYRLASVRAFDLFPNTPHVEAVAVFDGGRL
jgi:23S rRNA (uracil1939-C5)-methyltransferase